MIQKRNINVLGRTIDIAYNMATQIAYEEITGKPFDVADMDRTGNTMALYYACIVANNKDTDITFDELIGNADASDITTLREAVTASFSDWCKSAMPDDGKKKKKEGKAKNS